MFTMLSPNSGVSLLNHLCNLKATTVVFFLSHRLISILDCNFLLEVEQSGSLKRYLLKFYNGVESENLEFLHAMGIFCETLYSNSSPKGVTIPKPIHSINGKTFEILENCAISSCNTHHRVAVRLFSWVPGVTLNAHGSNTELLYEVGRAIGIAKNSLSTFDDPSFHRYHAWDLSQFADVSKYFEYIDDSVTKDLVNKVYNAFVNFLLPISESFSKSIILGILLAISLLHFQEIVMMPISSSILKLTMLLV